jgi:uncharacterized membrane protein YccC
VLWRALAAVYFTTNLFVFAAAVFVLGLLCAAFRMEKTAYRYASITLAIIVLIPRSNAAWIVALHRFGEVSVGIVVGLAIVAAWPERQPEATEKAPSRKCLCICPKRALNNPPGARFVSADSDNARVVTPA